MRCGAVALLCLGIVLAAGCQPPAPPDTGPQGTSALVLWPGDESGSRDREFCDLLSAPAAPGGRFVFALTDSVVPARAPVPHNPSERIVFAQLYETLVRMDCDGTLRPGLAERWTCTGDSTVWVFTLRADARFWDGARVNAADVKRAWCSNQSCLVEAGEASPWAWFNARASTISVLDAGRLSIRLPEPQADFPALLTHPATAVAARRDGWLWPVGSGPARLRAATPPPLPDLVCRPNPQHPEAPAWKELEFRVLPGTDPRDLAGQPFDLARVEDLEAVRFFRELGGYEPVALPWNRLYLLICPPAKNPRGGARWLDPAGRLDPARDLTRIAARDWAGLVVPAGNSRGCPQLAGPITGGSSARRGWGLAELLPDAEGLVYDREDPGATELAGRLVALRGLPARAVGVPGPAVSFALQWQMAGACLVPMDLEFPTPCLQLASLLGQASWLQAAALAGRVVDEEALDPESLAAAEQAFARAEQLMRLDPADRLVRLGLARPVALTHPWLITHGELGGIRLDFDGTPRLAGLGRAETPGVLP